MNNPNSKHHPLGLVAFDHVTLIVADVQASRDFYVGKLGMKEVERPDFDFDGAWFKLGESLVHITMADENAGQAGWGDRRVGRIGRGHHLAFRTSDFTNAVQAIQDNQIPVAVPPRVRPDGASQVFVLDPDGHLIEICC